VRLNCIAACVPMGRDLSRPAVSLNVGSTPRLAAMIGAPHPAFARVQADDPRGHDARETLLFGRLLPLTEV
jgi:hypothetical protein